MDMAYNSHNLACSLSGVTRPDEHLHAVIMLIGGEKPCAVQ